MSRHDEAIVFSNLTADGNTSPTKKWGGGKGTFYAIGDFGGGTATLQWSPDDSTFGAVGTETTLTADGQGNFEAGEGHLRVNLNGATSPDLDSGVRPFGY